MKFAAFATLVLANLFLGSQGQFIHPNCGTAPNSPWLAHIEGPKKTCVGSLISDKYVLSSAYCVEDPLQKLQIRLAGFTYKIASINRFKNELALVKLESVVQLNDIVMPICVYAQANLSLQQQIESTDDLWQSSWRNGRVDKILGPVSRIDTKTCQDTFIKEITEDKICGEPYSMEMNYGSGGAPLEILTIDNGQQKIVQIGVVLLGKPDNTGPLIYSNLLKFSNWIARSVLENI